MAPRATTIRSRARPAFFERKMKMATAAEMAPPILVSRPSMALSPSPVPAMLPMLKTSPPTKTRPASTQPAPGSTLLPSTWARSPETPMIRQTFSWTAMSTRIETRMAKAKAAPSWTVKTVVWVMKPGPMALVAIRNMAPSKAVRLALGLTFTLVAVLSMVIPIAGRCGGRHRGFQQSRGCSTIHKRFVERSGDC